MCTDGTLASWGNNASGQLGNNSTTSSNVPVLVNTSVLKAGERFVPLAGSLEANILVAAPPQPDATTVAATGITDTGATVKGNVR